MSRSVFVSYSSKQGSWVLDRLVPCLRAASVEVFVDKERFEAGKAVMESMDEWQEKADLSLLVLTPDYLSSKYCMHELEQAVKKDRSFKKGLVIPIVREDCRLPDKVRRAELLHVDLIDEDNQDQWRKLFDACEADLGDLGASARDWLLARDNTRTSLKRNESVNLVVRGRTGWRPLVEHLRDDCVTDLGLVNLDNPATLSRRGLVQAMLTATGTPGIVVPDEPNDLAELGRIIESRKSTRIALTHFDLVANRSQYNAIDLFSAIRYWLMDSRKLVLLVQSRSPFNTLVPSDHPLSPIVLKIVELKGKI